MKLALFLSAATIAAASEFIIEARAAGQCNPGNNCQRGVGGSAGSNPPPASRLADCSRLNTVTVTPSPVTSTVYTTTEYSYTNVYSTTVTLPALDRRATDAVTVYPSSVPPYATYCDNASKYYSACSCVGATPVTTTAPVPTSYVSTATTTTITCSLESLIVRATNAMSSRGLL